MKYLHVFVVFLLLGCAGSKTYQSSNFTDNEKDLIRAGGEDDPMRVLKITNKQDSIILRTKSKPVIPGSEDPLEDPLLNLFIERLYRTVTDSGSLGVGIAAPQVGILKQIIWVQRFDKENFPFEVYLNPVIRQYSDKKQKCREGCLSVPDRMDTLNSRSYAILIEYDRPDGSNHIEMVEDFTAVIFQHEIDHLNGIIYLDHLKEEMEQAD